MNVRSALFKNLLAGTSSKGAAILLRLAQVPLLLSFLGPAEYGRWLLLSSVPVWLTIGNLGFGSAASNQMAMAAAARRRHAALSMYATGVVLLTSICVAAAAMALWFVPRVSWEGFLSASPGRHDEFTLAMLWLIASVLVSFYNELFGGRYQAGRKAHVAIFLQSVRPLLEFLLLLAVLRHSTRLDLLGAMTFLAALTYTLLNGGLSMWACRWLRFSLRLARWKNVRKLWGKGVAFQAFPLGHAVVFQGTLYVVNAMLGPAAVALFGSARTFVRSVNQMMELVNQTVGSELTYLIGARKFQSAARVHRLSVGVSVVGSVAAVAVLAVIGHPLFQLWTGRSLDLSPWLLTLFLLPIPFQSLWFSSCVVLLSSNRHSGLAIRFLVGAAVACATSAALTHAFGLPGAALSTVAMDLILIPYVLGMSIRVTEDNWADFRRGVPRELHAAWHSALTRLGIANRAA